MRYLGEDLRGSSEFDTEKEVGVHQRERERVKRMLQAGKQNKQKTTSSALNTGTGWVARPEQC